MQRRRMEPLLQPLQGVTGNEARPRTRRCGVTGAPWLGDEAYNAVPSNRRQAAFEGLALMQKYNLSENVAASIVGCALTYPPV